MNEERLEMLNWTQNRLNAALANSDEGITLSVRYDMDRDEWVAAIVDEDGHPVSCESNWEVFLQSRSPKFDRALELLELVCKADGTFDGDVNEFERYLTLVLNNRA